MGKFLLISTLILAFCIIIGCCSGDYDKKQLPIGESINLKPGAYWSHDIMGAGKIGIVIDYQPEDANVSVMILDASNFTNFQNNKPFTIHQSSFVTLNQGVPFKNHDNGSIVIDRILYIVVKNVGLKDASVHVWITPA